MSDLEEVSVEDIESSDDDEVLELQNGGDKEDDEIINEYENEEETEVDDDEEEEEVDGVEETKEDNNDDDDNDQVDDEIIDTEDEIIIKSETKKATKTNKKNVVKTIQPSIAITLDNDDDSSDDESCEDEDYLKKFDKEIRKNYLVDFHPESLINNYSEIQSLTQIVRDARTGIIVDDLHKTIPFLTKYEKTRILGQRAKQINSGAKPYINIDKEIMDGYIIAIAELEHKRLPFIIRRPLPNGGSEYWKLSDLQLID